MYSTFLLLNAQQAHKRFASLWREAKPWLVSGHQLVLTIKPATRSSGQNAALHAWFGEIAKTLEWAGKRRDLEVWKRLLTAAWLRARGEASRCCQPSTASELMWCFAAHRR